MPNPFKLQTANPISIPKVGVYIDGANIIHGGLESGWLIDYSKLINFVKRSFNPVIISYYDCTGYERDTNGIYLKDGNGNYLPKSGQIKFHNALMGLGIRIRTKPVKFIRGDEGKPVNKMDGDLIVDALKEEKQWDELILYGGDCDYEALVDQMISLAKKVHIFSYKTRLAHELKSKAFSSPFVVVTLIDNLRGILERERQG